MSSKKSLETDRDFFVLIDIQLAMSRNWRQ